METIEKDYLETEKDNNNVSERILALSDELSEEIILENIEKTIESTNYIQERINYFTNFKNKYNMITPDDENYDKEYLNISLTRVTDMILNGLVDKYSINMGNDIIYSLHNDFLENVETLYEFFYVRNYSNLLDYFKAVINLHKNEFIDTYKRKAQENEYADDLFMSQAKKKYKNYEDTYLIEFLPEIIEDIKSDIVSGIDLFQKIINLDKFEEYNDRMDKMIANYGPDFTVLDDEIAAAKYLAPLGYQETYSEFKNALQVYILDNLILVETYGKN